MSFKRSGGTSAVPSDPVQLYRTLAETNTGPESLWYHQGTVLLDWHSRHAEQRDVAIELPTGAGKTLVGGLIGEYRRRAFRERVAYLCPTRQLARQTADKLSAYGIPNVLLTGKVKSWNAADRARYNSADAVAVSVYSHLFNVNPALNNADLLLLDDAHAAESAVAGPWSLKIDRADEESAYLDVLAALGNALDPLVIARLRTTTADGQYRGTVYLASPLGVAVQAAQLEQILVAASAAGKLSNSASYTLQFLEGHLDHCLLYLSYQSILIRPLIAPTLVHPAFDDPVRRIYMSATLGSGGELERIFGRRAITRIPTPDGWEKQGTGRRLFCFPELTSDLAYAPEKVESWVAEVVENHDRAIILTPDGRTADNITETCLPAEWEVFRAVDVEDDLEEFTSTNGSALVLHNRYDGLDLPDDDCRLVVMAGLPARGDLQERFLHGSLGALEVLQERIRARIMQGAGRATRNAKDFAAVVILGDDLVSYVIRHDVQASMHPEIHAELEFGYRNSIDTTSTAMLENLSIFADHGETWREVDQDIVDSRERYERRDAPGSVELQRAARHEVAACDAIWQGDWQRALDSIRQVLDALRGGRASQRYAALWNYLAACIAHRLALQASDSALTAAATTYFTAARAAGRGTTWLSHLAAPSDTVVAPPAADLDPLDEQAMTGLVANAARLGKPSVFDTEINVARAALLDTPSKPYEAALVTLGLLAGATPSEGDKQNDAAPDATWIFGTTTWVVWEAKSQAEITGVLGADDVRQAGGHLRYIATKRAEVAPGDSSVLLMTPQHGVHPSAQAVAEGHVFLVTRDDVVDLFDRLVRAWRTTRTRDIPSLSAADVASIFGTEGALPTQWLPKLRTRPLRAAPS